MKSLFRPSVHPKTSFFGAATMGIAMCMITAPSNRLAAAAPASDQTKYAVAADNDFAADLYLQLAKEQSGKNLFFSPYSMLSALAMTAEGARGETALQMGQVLCFPAAARNPKTDAGSVPWNMSLIDSGITALNERYNPKPASKELLDKIAALRKDLDDSQQLEKSLQQQNKWNEVLQQNRKSQDLAGQLNALLAQVDQYELRVANALWVEKTYPLSPAYLDTIHKYYGASGAFSADFKGDPEGERQKINAWVLQQTNERIKDLLPPRSISAMTRLVLANAIYFKGQWSKPFDAGDTKDEDFNLADGTKVSVPMMHNSSLNGGRYGAFNADGSPFATPRVISFGRQPDEKTLYPGKGGFLVAELPYKGGDLAMVAIVPRDIDGLAALEEKLSGANLAAWLAKLEGRKIDMQLPKFKLETEYCMNGTLKALGMVRAFTPPGQAGGAQFDGMCASQDPANKLYIGYVVHKAFVEVNEKGTEAAAATAIVMATAAARAAMPFVPVFRADRPFLFAIRDVKAGTILFLGRLSSPKG